MASMTENVVKAEKVAKRKSIYIDKILFEKDIQNGFFINFEGVRVMEFSNLLTLETYLSKLNLTFESIKSELANLVEEEVKKIINA